jgi:hypothetical protein
MTNIFQKFKQKVDHDIDQLKTKVKSDILMLKTNVLNTAEKLKKPFIAPFHHKSKPNALGEEKKLNLAEKIIGQTANRSVLQNFEEQNLTWFEEQRLKRAFKTHNFYVTKFPTTSPQIFPKAVKVLYNLIKYVGGNQTTFSRLELLWDLKSIEQFGKQNYNFYKTEWDFASLLNIDPSISMEDFLLHHNESIILSGLFGLQNKRIDVSIYKKFPFGRFGKGQEIVETKITLQDVFTFAKKKDYVIVIYDLNVDKARNKTIKNFHLDKTNIEKDKPQLKKLIKLLEKEADKRGNPSEIQTNPPDKRPNKLLIWDYVYLKHLHLVPIYDKTAPNMLKWKSREGLIYLKDPSPQLRDRIDHVWKHLYPKKNLQPKDPPHSEWIQRFNFKKEEMLIQMLDKIWVHLKKIFIIYGIPTQNGFIDNDKTLGVKISNNGAKYKFNFKDNHEIMKSLVWRLYLRYISGKNKKGIEYNNNIGIYEKYIDPQTKKVIYQKDFSIIVKDIKKITQNTVNDYEANIITSFPENET